MFKKTNYFLLFFKKIFSNKFHIRNFIIFLVVVRVLFLISIFNDFSIILTKDSTTYLRLSQDIQYFYFNDNLNDFWASTFRPIGFPLTLSIFGLFFEIKYFVFLNLIFDLITSRFLFMIISKIINVNYANVGVIIFLLNLNILISSSQVLTESFTLMLITGSLYFLITKNIFFSGMFLLMFSTVKAYGLYFYILFFVVYIFVYKFSFKKLLYFSIFPIVTFIPILVNNYIQYEKVFITTSSSFHLTYLNNASKQLCKDINFENEIISDPSWSRDNFINSLSPKEIKNSEKFISALEKRGSEDLLNNINCKFLSIFRSIFYQMFGIRSSNWGVIYEGNIFTVIATISVFYVLVSNFSLIFYLFIKKTKELNIFYSFATLHILICSIIPYGNPRFRVLIETSLIILILYNLKHLNDKYFRYSNETEH